MATTDLDFDDDLVIEMVKTNHTPEEVWAFRTGGPRTLTAVICEKDAHDWPCPTIQALRRRTANGTGQHL